MVLDGTFYKTYEKKGWLYKVKKKIKIRKLTRILTTKYFEF